MDTSVTIRDFDAFSVQGRIAGFYRRYGEAWGRLARYGAFPLVLTADVLYRLWERFFKDSRKDGGVPWYGVADVLLSNLCQMQLGESEKGEQELEEVYRMELSIREELLRGLTDEELRELSEFLVEYVQQQVKNRKLAERQGWVALAYVQPTKVAQELAQALRRAYLAEDKGQLVQLAALVETLAEPLRGGFEPLLVVGHEYGAYGRGVPSEREGAEEVAGVRLEYPRKRERTPLRWFSFEVVTVNRRGEEINRELKQAQYFSEDCNGVNLEMVAIPGGEFMMGSLETEKDSYSDERPQHRVTVQPFFMGKYAITQGQWKAVARLPKVKRDLKPEPSYFKGENRPVESITWYDAVEFCARLSRYTGKEYRLPSEAEWEYACRAGTITPFHFGETITTKLANYNGNYTYAEEPKGEYRKETTPVGYFQVANPFGLYDMHGNVWEWCADEWHDNYEGATRDGTIWLNSDERNNEEKRRLLRGGSWGNLPAYCRSAYRSRDAADGRHGGSGFRVVLSPVAMTNQLKIKN
ncbi:formylglycine-generating enzyme family protein [Roseofilum sp. BLCC_M154]|uniref:Formylglycine-generating enzyme family protein n=2 Tax=Roseofilum TaxID=1233426 RepID=A0ABT7AVV7_9CYAN|nr:formylglycine-generating enzyme family protein [Roseofilum acuticapitatum BLCC-M154]